MVEIDAVAVLEQRLEFLEGTAKVAELCNWPPDQIQELYDYLLEEIIRIDNLMFEICEDTEDPELAYLTREHHMEDLRHWLELILGIKIKFV